MKRLVFLLAVAACTGCQTSAPTGPIANPFLGRSTVPPPGTNAPPPASAPYYGNGQMLPPAVSGGAPLTPPGSNYGFQGATVDQSSKWRPGGELAENRDSEAPPFKSNANGSTQGTDDLATEQTAPASEAPAVIRASAEEPVRTEDPKPAPGDSTSTSGSQHSVIRIVEPAESTAAMAEMNSVGDGETKWEQQASGQSETTADDQRASASGPSASFAGFRGSPVEDSPANQSSPEQMSDSDRYGYASNYRRLRGRLEYSNIDRAWKLRYIPVGGIDGDNDEYGGSVVLPDVPELARFELGDFVEVEGAPLPRDAGDSGFAPQYDLRSIAALPR